MSAMSGDRELELTQGRWMERLLAIEVRLDAEVLAYIALVALTFMFHFWDLGSRALHHDESLHATYSYYLYIGQGYKHDPLMHGPVLFHLTALMYLLFGATSATARFSAALAGTLLVFTPLLLRRWIGRWGALAASTLLLFSPSILYYSRFIREDIFVALWGTGLFIAIWRYSQSRHQGWLYLAAASLALGFANKETTYMLAAIALIYADVRLAADLCRPVAEHIMPGHRDRATRSRRPISVPAEPSWPAKTAVFALLLPFAWAIAALWQPMERWRMRFGLKELPASGDLLILAGTLTLPQLAALVQIPLSHAGFNMNGAGYVYFGQTLSRTLVVGGLTVIILLCVSLLVGINWDWRRWLISAAVFYAIYVCLYTTFFTNPAGFGSGIWGSLDYWLSQQSVARGSQPIFYYAMVLPAYEYLALAFAFIGVVYQAARKGFASIAYLGCSLVLLLCVTLVYGSHNLLAGVLSLIALTFGIAAVRGDPLRQLLLTWFGGMFFGLSLAGEKMPWLTIHLAVPLIFLAAVGINDLVEGFRADASARARSVSGRTGLRADGELSLLIGAVVLAAAVAILLAWGPGSDGVHVALFAVTLLLVALISASAGVLRSPRIGAAVAGALLLGLLAPLSLRVAMNLSFVHGDTPYDMLVYTQTSPNVPSLMKDIDLYAQQSGKGANQPIVVDAYDGFSWPWAWYLRNYHTVSYIDLSAYISQPGGYRPPADSILLLNDANRSFISQLPPDQFGPGMPFHLRWWFPEDYRNTTTAGFLQSLGSGITWARWWGFLTAERGIVKPNVPAGPGLHQIGTSDATAYFPANYLPGQGITLAAASAVPTPQAGPNGSLTVGGPGALQGTFSRPAGIAVDTNGNFYVADSLNNRIEKFDASGHLVASADGSGNGQPPFHEPWDVAVDKQGAVYVADTWNHRIVKLDSQMHFVAAWGHPNKPTGPDGLLSLYGPRAIAIDPEGNLLVTDTGNNRVIKFSPTGQPLASFGTRGAGQGQFQEPVGLAVSPKDGTIYVADTWNGRIEVFDAAGHFLRSLPVRGWESHGIENKPYLALLANGDLLLTQPDADHLIEMNATSGALVRNVTSLGNNKKLGHPIGIATDASGAAYISDASTNQVTRLPVSALPQGG